MSNIRTPRLEFKPFEYQWAYDYWFQQQNAHWLHTEISMQQDIKDWNEKLSKVERLTIEEILKGFAQTECSVNDYWTGYVTKWFPKHEIKMMATTFGAFETIHATAYSYLNDTLGLTDFKAFTEDNATMVRLEQLINIPENATPREIALSLAIFSAFAEGVSLFSQFAILLSFKKGNMLPGISKQMIFSCRDESLHSEAGCKLYREYVRECPELLTEVIDGKTLADAISDAAELFMSNEMDYIDSIFKHGEIPTISKNAIKAFLYDRANRKLGELNLPSIFMVSKEDLAELDWFYPMISGEQQTDFFHDRESGYAKPNEDWNNADDLF